MESTQNRMGAAPVPKLPHADTLIWTAFPAAEAAALAVALVLMRMVAKRQLESME